MSDFDVYPDELDEIICPHCDSVYDKYDLENETDEQFEEFLRVEEMIERDKQGTLTCQCCNKKFYFEAVVEYRYCSKKIGE